MKHIILKLAGGIFLFIMLFCLSACSIPVFFWNLLSKDAYQEFIEYLREERIDMGDSYGDIQTFDGYSCMILYNKEDDNLSFSLTEANNIVVLKDLSKGNDKPSFMGRYYSSGVSYTGTGHIQRDVFSGSNKYIYDYSCNAPISLRGATKELFETATSLLLTCVNQMIKSYNIDISMSDLGFSQYF